jgi:hypothetical protein
MMLSGIPLNWVGPGHWAFACSSVPPKHVALDGQKYGWLAGQHAPGPHDTIPASAEHVSPLLPELHATLAIAHRRRALTDMS